MTIPSDPMVLHITTSFEPLKRARRHALARLRQVLGSAPAFLCRDLRANKRPLSLQLLQFLTRTRQAAVAKLRVSIPKQLVGEIVYVRAALDLIVDEFVFRRTSSPSPNRRKGPVFAPRPGLRETIFIQQVHVTTAFDTSRKKGRRSDPFFFRSS